MTNAVVLDLVVLVAVGIALVRGWSHRSIREFFSLLGLGVGLFLVPVLAGPCADVVERLTSLDINTARAVAAGLVLGIPALVGAIFGVRTSRAVRQSGPAKLDALGGVMFALMRSLLVSALALYVVSIISPDGGEEGASLARAVEDSVSGQLLAQPDAPTAILLDGMVESSDDLQALVLWARQRAGYSERVPGERLDFAATTAKLSDAAREEREMLELLNEERVDRGLEPLGWCAPCAVVARAHSKDMYRNGYFSHVDSAGLDPFDRMTEAGITYGAAGENLSIAPNVRKAHEGLMASTDHRENILRSLFEEAGIGCYEGPYGLMCTQVFRALTS